MNDDDDGWIRVRVDDDTVERIARALHALHEMNDEAVTEGDAPLISWEDEDKFIRESYRSDARVALDAITTPDGSA